MSRTAAALLARFGKGVLSPSGRAAGRVFKRMGLPPTSPVPETSSFKLTEACFLSEMAFAVSDACHVRTTLARTSRRLRERRALYFAFMNCHGCTMSNDIFSSALAAGGCLGWEEIQRARRCCWTCAQHLCLVDCRAYATVQNTRTCALTDSGPFSSHFTPRKCLPWSVIPEFAGNSERARLNLENTVRPYANGWLGIKVDGAFHS